MLSYDLYHTHIIKLTTIKWMLQVSIVKKKVIETKQEMKLLDEQNGWKELILKWKLLLLFLFCFVLFSNVRSTFTTASRLDKRTKWSVWRIIRTACLYSSQHYHQSTWVLWYIITFGIGDEVKYTVYVHARQFFQSLHLIIDDKKIVFVLQ